MDETALRRVCVGLLLTLALIWGCLAQAQAPAPAPVPAAPAALGEPAVPTLGRSAPTLRFHFTLIDQLSYTTHPFYQITEDPAYAGGQGASTSFGRIGIRETDDEAPTLVKLLHALPPFGIEGVMRIDLGFPRGIGWGFDFSPLPQNDADAADSDGNVTAIRMNTYYYSGVLRFYFFSPNEPGVNYFVGLGLGIIEGKVEVPFVNAPSQYIDFSQAPVGSTRLGLETKGDNWGFRYELMVLNADEVVMDSNPYDFLGDGANPTTIDFSGSIVRLTIYYQF